LYVLDAMWMRFSRPGFRASVEFGLFFELGDIFSADSSHASAKSLDELVQSFDHRP